MIFKEILLPVIGLFFLCYQIFQLNNQLFIQNYIAYTERYQNIIKQFPENINQGTFILKQKNENYSSTMRAMRQYYDLCFEEFWLYKNKKISKKVWLLWCSGMRFAFSKSAFVSAWKIIKTDTQYSNEFVIFVENNKGTGIE